MPDYTLVDKEYLENGLKIVGDSIRAKTGSTEKMNFPEGFKEQADSIEEAFWSKEFILKVLSNRASLTDITFPEGITAIESSFFNGASNLIITELPDSIKSIKSSAFYDCTKLGLTKLPESLTYIGESAFRNALIEITELPPQLETISNYAFLNRTRVKISVIPASVKTLGTRCFEGTGITEITFKGTPTSIGAGIFNSCSNLKVINVPWSETDPINVNAPWGASNVETINYNYVETEE